MTALPLIDARSGHQSLDSLLLTPEQTREAARTLGELWAVISIRGSSPFHGVGAECVTLLMLNSTDDAKVAEFAKLAQDQQLTHAITTYEMVGPRKDVGHAAYDVAMRAGPNIAEVTIRWIDSLVVGPPDESGFTVFPPAKPSMGAIS